MWLIVTELASCNRNQEVGARIDVLTAARANTTVFWGSSLCSLVEVDWGCLQHEATQITHRPQNTVANHVWIVGQLVRGYSEQHLRKLSSSQTNRFVTPDTAFFVVFSIFRTNARRAPCNRTRRLVSNMLYIHHSWSGSYSMRYTRSAVETVSLNKIRLN